MNSAASRYRITRLIQRGGMAEVFEASILGEGGFSRRVALKRLLLEHVDDDGFVRAFVAEAKLVGQLQHANIVGVYDFGTMDEVPFQVLEYVDGLDLVRLEAHAASMGIIPPAELWLAIVSEATHGLDYAHHARDSLGRALGIVHRDVTPTNVLVAWAGGVKLGDFGIAHSLTPRDGREPTRVGFVKGKLAYMAPEQLSGDGVDARSDVFAMGCVLHRMLAGSSPLETEDQRRRVLAGARPTIDARVPADLARILGKALEPDRNKRFVSAAQLATECARAVASRTAADARTTVRGWLEKMRPADRVPVSPLGQLMDVELVLGDDADELCRRFASTVGRIPDFDTRREMEARPDTGSARGGPRLGPSSTRPSSGPPRASLPPLVAPPLAPLHGAPPPIPRPSFAIPGLPGPAGRTPVSMSSPPASSGVSAGHDSLLGSVVGEYTIIDLLGKGGFARVYRARHLVFGKEFALKVLLENYKDSPGAQRRFQREALALHAVSHPNLVGIEDSGVTSDGRPYIVMELAQGVTLREALIDAGGAFGVHRTRRVARQIASALAEAHKQGLVHRDLKPKNVVLVQTPSGEEAKVLDFGLALLLDPRSELTRLTSAGHYLGTARWMAPEQVVNAAEVGPAADLYCLGLVMFAMAVGQPPFRGTPEEVMRKHREEVPEIPAVAGPFAPLIARLLEKDPTRRPGNAQQVIEALSRLDLGPEAAESHEPTRIETVATEAGALPTTMLPEPGTVPFKAMRATRGESREILESRESMPAMVVQHGRTMARGTFAALAALSLATAGVLGAVVALTVRDRRDLPVLAAPVEPLPGIRLASPEPLASPMAVAPPPSAEPPAAAEPPAEPPAAAEPTPTPDAARVVRAELEALRAAYDQRVATELAKRSLTRADLELAGSARAARSAWSAALAARDPRAVERAGNGLVAAVQAFEIDRESLRAQLEAAHGSLMRAAKTQPPATLGPLERRYLDARSGLSSNRSTLEIARELRELERDIRALGP